VLANELDPNKTRVKEKKKEKERPPAAVLYDARLN
jgi:hypothetical protein